MIRAVGGRVIVMPLKGETDGEGRPMKDGIYLAREVQHPVGLVVSVGEDVKGVKEGDRVVWVRDIGATFVHGGVQLSSLTTRTKCPHCDRKIREDSILGTVHDAENDVGIE